MGTISSKDIIKPAIEQIELLMAPDCEPTEELIHKTRVAIKRLRARIRMLRKLIGDKQYMSVLVEHAKTLSRELSTQRDLDVMSALLSMLAEQQKDATAKAVLEKVKFRMIVAQEDNCFDQETVYGFARTIHTDYNDAQEHTLSDEDVRKFIRKRVRRVFEQGEKVLTDGVCEPLHEWRKDVKTFLYQNELLSEEDELLPKKPLADLGKKLGRVHDICVLDELVDKMQDRPSPFLNKEEYKLLMGIVRSHEQDLFDQTHDAYRVIQAAIAS